MVYQQLILLNFLKLETFYIHPMSASETANHSCFQAFDQPGQIHNHTINQQYYSPVFCSISFKFSASSGPYSLCHIPALASSVEWRLIGRKSRGWPQTSRKSNYRPRCKGK